MRWRGDKEKADNYIIKEKVRDFVRHHKNKDNNKARQELEVKCLNVMLVLLAPSQLRVA